MPEGEGAQERAQRRGCRHPATRQPPRLARSQDLAVIDAVRAEHHREHQRRHLAPGVRGARPVASQPDQPPRQRFDPQAFGEGRDQHHSCVRDGPLVIEFDSQTVQSDRLVIMHLEGDLLCAGSGCSIQPLSPAQEVILLSSSDGSDLPTRWIQA